MPKKLRKGEHMKVRPIPLLDLDIMLLLRLGPNIPNNTNGPTNSKGETLDQLHTSQSFRNTLLGQNLPPQPLPIQLLHASHQIHNLQLLPLSLQNKQVSNPTPVSNCSIGCQTELDMDGIEKLTKIKLSFLK